MIRLLIVVAITLILASCEEPQWRPATYEGEVMFCRKAAVELPEWYECTADFMKYKQ